MAKEKSYSVDFIPVVMKAIEADPGNKISLSDILYNIAAEYQKTVDILNHLAAAYKIIETSRGKQKKEDRDATVAAIKDSFAV